MLLSSNPSKVDVKGRIKPVDLLCLSKDHAVILCAVKHKVAGPEKTVPVRDSGWLQRKSMWVLLFAAFTALAKGMGKH